MPLTKQEQRAIIDAVDPASAQLDLSAFPSLQEPPRHPATMIVSHRTSATHHSPPQPLRRVHPPQTPTMKPLNA